MTYTVTDRGFKHYEKIPTDYGHEIAIYESSSAMKQALWMNVELDHEVGGIEPEAATAHLTFPQAVQVATTIIDTMTNHYQGHEARVEAALKVAQAALAEVARVIG